MCLAANKRSAKNQPSAVTVYETAVENQQKED